jgi:hypothetical protein
VQARKRAGAATGAFDPNQSLLWRLAAASALDFSVCVAPAFQAGSVDNKRASRGNGDETEPKVRVGGDHDVGCNPGLARAGWSDRSHRGLADECKNVFVRKGKAKKDDGQTVSIIASCATDIMLFSVQFELNVVNPDKIRRLFPGMEDMEIFYYR